MKIAATTLDELEKLMTTATSGPWVCVDGDHIPSNKGDNALNTVASAGDTVAECWENPSENAALIAAARNALPDLIKLVRVADEVLTYLEQDRQVPTIQRYNLEKALGRLGL